jgi:hypothetical protein
MVKNQMINHRHRFYIGQRVRLCRSAVSNYPEEMEHKIMRVLRINKETVDVDFKSYDCVHMRNLEPVMSETKSITEIINKKI